LEEILLGHGSKAEETDLWRLFSASIFVPFREEKRLLKLRDKSDAIAGFSSSIAGVPASNGERLNGSGSISSGISSP
jgi:hypothetical protein